MERKVVNPASVLVSLVGWLTELASDTTMALVEDGAAWLQAA